MPHCFTSLKSNILFIINTLKQNLFDYWSFLHDEIQINSSFNTAGLLKTNYIIYKYFNFNSIKKHSKSALNKSFKMEMVYGWCMDGVWIVYG